MLAQVVSVVLCLLALTYILAGGEAFKQALSLIVVPLAASIPIVIADVR